MGSRRSIAQIVSTTEAEAACVESGAGLTHLQAIGPFHLVTDEDVEIPAARSVITLEQLLQSSTTVPSFPTILADDLAALMFTSDWTAAPRGVMVSHGNIIANTTSIIQSVTLRPSMKMATSTSSGGRGISSNAEESASRATDSRPGCSNSATSSKPPSSGCLIPKEVVLLSSMPKSEAGKVLKSELARL